MALSCAEFLRHLDEDEAETLASAEMRDHAAACPACRVALERRLAIAGEMRAWAEEPPPAFLHTRLMAELRAARAPERRARGSWWAWRPLWVSSALAVAVVVVAAGLTLLRPLASIQVKEDAGASRTQAPARMAAVPAPPPSVSEHATGGHDEDERDTAQRAPLATSRPRPAPERAAGRLEERDAKLEAKQKNELARGADAGDAAVMQREDAPRDALTFRGAAAPPPQSRAAREQGVEGGVGAERSPSGQPAGPAAVAETEGAPAPIEKASVSRAKETSRRVHCRLFPLAGGPTRTVDVSPALLGQRTSLIDVDTEGRIRLVPNAQEFGIVAGVAAAEGRRKRVSAQDEEQPLTLGAGDRTALDALALAPGRYRIERVDE
jgi:hypothetical protein